MRNEGVHLGGLQLWFCHALDGCYLRIADDVMVEHQYRVGPYKFCLERHHKPILRVGVHVAAVERGQNLFGLQEYTKSRRSQIFLSFIIKKK